MDDKQLRALVRKNAAKAQKVQTKRQRTFDPTIDATRGPEAEESTTEAEKIFKEMKRREF